MTEAEWLACTDPTPMLEFLQVNGNERKLRLFAVVCCHRVWNLLQDERSRQAVVVAEWYACDLASEEEMDAAAAAASESATAVADHGRADAKAYAAAAAFVIVSTASSALAALNVAELTVAATANAASPCFTNPAAFVTAQKAERREQCGLLRDLFGSLPFRPVSIPMNWKTSKAGILAQAIYDELGFGRMPELADALVDAGCDNQEILSHLRSPGPHVRGCFAVDLVLGKD